jgi:hypothetical protein
MENKTRSVPKPVVAATSNSLRENSSLELVMKTRKNLPLSLLGGAEFGETSGFLWRKAPLNKMRECLLRVHVLHVG